MDVTKMKWPNPATADDDDESDRQLILLALAELALRRPGWNWTLNRLACRLNGRVLFESFKVTSGHTNLPDINAVGSNTPNQKQQGQSE